ncbi:MAG: hypothetical protein LUM44_10000 [Pyrinomonadaceae bacterium]|nr:hypothetical protein [Pyrinomonadaceae bacterium]
MKHGEERPKIRTVESGKLTIKNREKLCIAHGWIDTFAIGGELEWQRQHGKCNHQPRSESERLKLAA